VVALESTVITHGLPYPENIDLAKSMETVIRQNGAIPATVAVLNGQARVGVSAQELEQLAGVREVHKISSRDIGPAIVGKWTGGTTVAGTMAIASRAGLRVFATGGIGGVHRGGSGSTFSYDISADLPELARTPMIVVCAGAKAILDLAATLEYLETAGTPVVGYQTDEFPAFYSIHSGLKTSARADTAEQAARIAQAHWGFGLSSAVLVAAPPPVESAVPVEAVEAEIQAALDEAVEKNIRGQAVTPFLLQRVNELSGGASLKANLALLRNNGRVAAGIAVALSEIG
jgi:pseudouridine-5'-phosphate glycosidase